MLYLVKFLYKTFLLPPGIFIILLLAIGIRLYKREKWLAKALLLLTFFLYLFSTDYIGDVLIRSLENRYQPPTAINGDVLVMLGGGATLDTPDINGYGNLSGDAANRLLTTARLQIKTGLPIIISSGESYADSGNESQIAKRQLIGLGIAGSKIIIEDKSRDTRENARNTAQILNSSGFKHPVLITSAFHMDRSVRDFAKYGIIVQPYPADYITSIKPFIYPSKFIPTSDGLSKTSITIKEYLGIVQTLF